MDGLKIYPGGRRDLPKGYIWGTKDVGLEWVVLPAGVEIYTCRTGGTRQTSGER